jgi:hypothetical protein
MDEEDEEEGFISSSNPKNDSKIKNLFKTPKLLEVKSIFLSNLNTK